MKIKMITGIAPDNHRYKRFLVSYLYRCGKNIGVIPPPFPILLEINLPSMLYYVRNCCKGYCLSPTNSMRDITLNSFFVNDYIPKTIAKNLVAKASEEFSYRLGQFLASFRKFISGKP